MEGTDGGPPPPKPAAPAKKAAKKRHKLPSYKIRSLKLRGVGDLMKRLLPRIAAKTSCAIDESIPTPPLTSDGTAQNCSFACDRLMALPAPSDHMERAQRTGSGSRDDSDQTTLPERRGRKRRASGVCDAPQDGVPAAAGGPTTGPEWEDGQRAPVAASYCDARPVAGGDTAPTRPRTSRGLASARRRARANMPEEVRQSEELHKYWFQRHRLFSRFNEGVQLDRDSWFSVTPEAIATHIAERCRCDVVVDAFCGCGGNTIQFALTCHQVIAIDIDPERVRRARHNAAVYGVQDRVQFIVGDFFQLAPSLRADVVFLSPPWGGPAYQHSEVYDMFAMDGVMDGRRMMAAAQSISPSVALLAPRNADKQQLAIFAGAGGSVEVENNLLNGRVKTITAYYGDLMEA